VDACPLLRPSRIGSEVRVTVSYPMQPSPFGVTATRVTIDFVACSVILETGLVYLARVLRV
jgi:hypothetical protein